MIAFESLLAVSRAYELTGDSNIKDILETAIPMDSKESFTPGVAIRLYDGRVIGYPPSMPKYPVGTYLTVGDAGILRPIEAGETTYYVGVVIPW